MLNATNCPQRLPPAHLTNRYFACETRNFPRVCYASLMTPLEATASQAKDVARKVTESINDQANYIRDTASSTRYNLEDYIQNNPWSAVALAATFGLLLGIVVARR